jgi:hypothetical protein
VADDRGDAGERERKGAARRMAGVTREEQGSLHRSLLEGRG